MPISARIRHLTGTAAGAITAVVLGLAHTTGTAMAAGCPNGGVTADGGCSEMGMAPIPLSEVSDPGLDAGGPPAGFIVLAVIIVIVGIGLTALRWKYTHKFATEAGLSDDAATNLTVFGGEVGLATAYALREQKNEEARTQQSAQDRDAERNREARISEVRALEARGLLGHEQAEARIAEILDEI